MTLSARSTMPGKVVAVTRGVTTAPVTIEVAPGFKSSDIVGAD
jgi:molybdopterin-binding protein